MNLKNKNIWVVGGAGYLGQATIKFLCTQGAKVLCIDKESQAQNFINAAGLNVQADFVELDINQTSITSGFVKEQVRLHCTPDGLVNLTFGSTAKTLEELTVEDFDSVNHTALSATFIFAREVAGYMIENKGGSIVFFSSMYGMVSPDANVYKPPMNKNPLEYGVGKAAIIQMTKYLAVHWAKENVRCNCISPGPFPNPVVQKEYPDFIERLAQKSPMGRIGKAEEIAGSVAFLLSDAATYITGHNLVVDGGWTCW